MTPGEVDARTQFAVSDAHVALQQIINLLDGLFFECRRLEGTNTNTQSQGRAALRSCSHRHDGLTSCSTVAGPFERSRSVPLPVPSWTPDADLEPPDRWLIMSVNTIATRTPKPLISSRQSTDCLSRDFVAVLPVIMQSLNDQMKHDRH